MPFPTYTPPTEAELEIYRAQLKVRDAANAEAGKDLRVRSIRADKAVGEGTCSVPDECYSNTELLEELNQMGITDPVQAVKWARERDGLHWESGTNQCSGETETDTPILAMHQESVARNQLPIVIPHDCHGIDYCEVCGKNFPT